MSPHCLPTSAQGTKASREISSIDRREWMICTVGYLHYLKAKSHVFLERRTISFFLVLHIPCHTHFHKIEMCCQVLPLLRKVLSSAYTEVMKKETVFCCLSVNKTNWVQFSKASTCLRIFRST